MEEPLGHIRVPHQHVPADMLSVRLAPGDHPVGVRIVHPGHSVLAPPGSVLVQQRIRLGFICAGQGIEMIVQEIHKYSIVHIPDSEGSAQSESIWFRKSIQRFIIIRHRPGRFCLADNRHKAKDKCGCQDHKTFHG